jgi:hypothetical protein
VQISLAGHFQIWHRFYVHVPVSLGNLGIEGNRVNSCDEGFLQAHILEITPGGSVAEEHAAGINELESSHSHLGSRECVGEVRVLSAEDAVPVFVPRVTPVRL